MSEPNTLQRLVEQKVLSEVDVLFARALGRLANEHDEHVLLAAALCNRAPRFGHVAVDLTSPTRGIRAPEGEITVQWPDPSVWQTAAAKSRLVRPQAGDTSPLVLDGSRLYLRRYHEHQQVLGALLRTRATQTAAPVATLYDDDPLLKGASPRQREAIRTAMGRALTVVTGGPGTGKTWLVLRALVALVRARLIDNPGAPPPNIRLLAPTGKAAARLGESVATGLAELTIDDIVRDHIPVGASTIHSALGVKGGHLARFWRTADNPLDADIVVVDEASMVDLVLMRRLVEAVPDSASLILLGDQHQLASVEAGAVLADLCHAATRAPDSAWSKSIVTLLESHRFDPKGPVGRLAAAILAGDEAATLSVLQEGTETVRWLPPNKDRLSKEATTAVHASLESHRTAVRAGDDEAMLAAQSTFRILCAHRRGRLGVSGLNKTAATAVGIGPTQQTSWYPGRPILVRENDHEQQLYNGDIGITCAPTADGAVRVAFPGGPDGIRRILASRLPGYETVFALTIHKSQGSEFDHVMVVIPDGSQLCTRELLYTAVTRARHRVTLIASTEAIRQALAQRVERITGLEELVLA